MVSLTGFVRRAAALAALALSASLGGCVYDSYYHASAYDNGGGDYYYGQDYGYDGYYGGGYYGGWYAYDALFWPSWYWYSPFYWPGYYYGVSYHHWGHHHHGHGGYHHYSPYRGSWGDNVAYYGGADWRHGQRDEYSGYRFGSARNEAERLARNEGLSGAAQRSRSYAPGGYGGGAYGGGPRGYGAPAGGTGAAGTAQRGNWSRGIDYGDRTNDAATRRDAGARAADPSWSRYQQPAPGRAQGNWRAQPRPTTGAQPQQIDGRTFRGPGDRSSYQRYERGVDRADANSRGGQPGLQYEAPVPRGAPGTGSTPQVTAPQPVQPSSGSYLGGRPESSSRSYEAPSAPSSPRGIDTGGGHDSGGRSEGGRSREPD